jgi:hypothetical protein
LRPTAFQGYFVHSNLDHPISSLNSYWSKAMSQEVTRAESIEEQESKKGGARLPEDYDCAPPLSKVILCFN